MFKVFMTKEKINQGPFQPSGTRMYYLGAFHEKRCYLFAFVIYVHFKLIFVSKLQAVYWVVSPRCIKYATTFFELLL